MKRLHAFVGILVFVFGFGVAFMATSVGENLRAVGVMDLLIGAYMLSSYIEE